MPSPYMPAAEGLGYLGRYRQGDELPLTVQCVNENGQSAWPLTAPVVTFVWPDGTNVLSRVMAADLQGVRVGTFRLAQFLGHVFDTVGNAGTYAVLVRYDINIASVRSAIVLAGHFRLLLGGDEDGAVISMRPVRRPNANYLVYQTDGGRLVRVRNPR